LSKADLSKLRNIGASEKKARKNRRALRVQRVWGENQGPRARAFAAPPQIIG
jgi:hypothetical protein